MPKYSGEITLGNLLMILSLVGGLALFAVTQSSRLAQVEEQHRAMQQDMQEVREQLKQTSQQINDLTRIQQEDTYKLNEHIGLVHKACK